MQWLFCESYNFTLSLLKSFTVSTVKHPDAPSAPDIHSATTNTTSAAYLQKILPKP